jgi:hypothetical protein
MKPIAIIITVFVLSVSQLAGSDMNVSKTKTDWQAFSENLVVALKSNNEGLQQSAMSQIIRYADNVDVDDAVYDVMQIYRSNKNESVRRLALTTLYKMQNKWALSFLRRAVQFEESPVLKNQICHILKDCAIRTAIAKKLEKEKEVAALTTKK